MDQIPQDAPDETVGFLTVKEMPQSQTGGLSEHLLLKEGRAMVICNIDIKDRLINSQMGFAFDFALKGGKITKIYVKFDDAKAREVARSNDSDDKRNRATPVTMVEAHLSAKVYSHMINCKRVHFLLTLAWACTVHKVQGLTIGKVAVCLQSYKQKSPNAEQLHLAEQHLSYTQTT